jgi:hypothetical protein
MSERNYGLGDVVDAVLDLTRVTVALHGNFPSKAEAIRKLSELSIPGPRIAAILSMSTRDVASSLAKAKKKARPIDELIPPTAQGEINVEISDR